MFIVKNKILPPKGFLAINLFGVLFTRKDNLDVYTINHEEIHTKQMKELGYIFFYIWYGIEWLIRLFKKGDAYRNISFEKEAYANEYNLDYIKYRHKYAWFKYI